MRITAAIVCTGFVALLAGCVTSAPCSAPDCSRIGWFTQHSTCKCEKKKDTERVAVLPPAPPPPARGTGTTFTVFYQTSHPCLALATRTEIDKVVGWMKANPGTSGQILGYTDTTEDRKRQDWLSSRRALVVRDYMVRKGIGPDRLSHEGRGAANPVADSSTAAGRAKNRRVEITVE